MNENGVCCTHMHLTKVSTLLLSTAFALVFLIDTVEAKSKPVPPVSRCSIKGNISAKKEKIYHLPGCASYKVTVITPSSGERMFCSEKEAREAGWRKALNCPK